MAEIRRNSTPAGSHAGREATDPQHRRLAYKASRIEAARASVARGEVVPFEAVRDWIDSIGTADEKPPPAAD